MNSIRLSIIIVNYKTSQLVFDCLNSIGKFDISKLEIIVVDNDSQDNIGSDLSSSYPDVLFIQMNYNSGFARANNAGIRIAKGNAVLLLNSDTIITNDAINHCFDKLISSEYVGSGVQLLNIDGSPQISGNYAMTGGLNYLLPLPYLGSFIKWLGEVFKVKKPNVPDAKEVIEVDWINGAFLMVKKEAVEKAGLLDEDFFLYAEEAEWCSRLKKHGKLCIFGNEKVIHLQGATSNEAFNSSGHGYFNLFDKKGLQIMLSNLVRIRKEFGLFWFLIIFFFHLINIPVFLAFLAVDFLLTKKTRFTFAQWKGYSINVISIFRFFTPIILKRRCFYKVL